MNVALLAPPHDSHEDGVGRNVRELARGVVRAGGRVEVLAHLPEATRDSVADDGITVRHFQQQGGSSQDGSDAIQSYLRRHGDRYDLVHAHGYPTLPAVLGALGLFGRLVFSPRHDGRLRTRIGQLTQSPHPQLGRSALASADLIICSCHAEAEEIARLIPAIAQRVRIIASGADTEEIAAARPFSVERRVILSIGRADGAGGADRAVSALPALGPGYELVVVRCGSARRRLRACAEDLQVSEQVRILDRVSDAVLHSWLRTANVVLALGDEDSEGTMLMECACAGVPVIGSDTPAHQEVARMLDDAAVRLLPRRASPLLLADHVLRLTEIRMNPLATLAVPTLEDVADQTVSLYSALLDDRLESDLAVAPFAPQQAPANGRPAIFGMPGSTR